MRRRSTDHIGHELRRGRKHRWNGSLRLGHASVVGTEKRARFHRSRATGNRPTRHGPGRRLVIRLPPRDPSRRDVIAGRSKGYARERQRQGAPAIGVERRIARNRQRRLINQRECRPPCSSGGDVREIIIQGGLRGCQIREHREHEEKIFRHGGLPASVIFRAKRRKTGAGNGH